MNSEKYLYTDISEVASGAFGTVLRAVERDELSKRPLRIVALKRLVEKAATERSIEKSDPVAESLVMEEFCHNNIIRCYDLFEVDSYHFLVLEFAPVSLQSLLKSSKVPLAVGINISKQLLTGLSQLHSKGVSHCDIKPSNLLISTSGKLKIADFGQATTDFNELNNFGTRIYRAPEAVLHGKWNFKVDIFSAGLIVFEMLAGRQLFAACSDVELIIQQNSLVGPFSGCKTLEESEDMCKIVLEDGWEKQERLEQILTLLCDKLQVIEFVMHMLDAEPEERWSADKLLECPCLSENVVRDDFIQRFMRYEDDSTVAGKTVCGVE